MCVIMENSVSFMVLDVELIQGDNVLRCMFPEEAGVILSLVRLLSESNVVIKILGHHLHKFN